MEWKCSSSMIERAKEELQILEMQHPNRFEYLKLDLKNFISTAESQRLLNSTISFSCASASTQASSSKKRKNSYEDCVIGSKSQMKQQKFPSPTHPKKRVDAVIKRAQACLKKIREMKSNVADSGDG